MVEIEVKLRPIKKKEEKRLEPIWKDIDWSSLVDS